MFISFIKCKAAKLNICEMAIILGLLAVASIFPAVGLVALLSYLLGASNQFAVLVPAGLWLGFVAWVWISFVLAGRNAPPVRVSTIELTAMQWLCAVYVGIRVFLAPASEQQIWQRVGQVFEWTIIGFHVIYFSLAWAMRAPVPLKTYLVFLGILSLAWLKS